MPLMTRTRAQSAMEYLMTYGWAILVIAVVLGALFGLGIFNGAAALGNGCLAQSGYLCQGAVLSTNGLLSVSIGQVAQPSITVVDVGCSNTASEPNIFTVLSPVVKLQAGQVAQTVFQCDLPTNTLGTSFVGTLWIKYNTSQYPGVTFPAEIGTISERAATVGGSGGGGGGPSHGGGGGSISCGTPPVTGQTIYIDVNSTMSVGILNDVNTSICASIRGRPQPNYVSPITYSWSTTGSCPGWSNPGNVDNYTYTPTSTSSTCTIDLDVSDTSGDSGSGSASVTVTPIPTVLAFSPNGLSDLVTDGTNLYWSTSDAIESVPVGGGSISTLASTPNVCRITTDGVNVYWTDGTNIYSVPINGGSVNTIATGVDSYFCAPMATDGQDVFFPIDGGLDVASVPVTGGSVNTIATDGNYVSGYMMATDGTNVYWMDGAHNIDAAPVGGGPVSVLATDTYGPSGFIAAQGGEVYWNDGSGYIDSVPAIGGSTFTIASGTDSYGVTTDGTNVYWTGPSGQFAAPVGGGSSVELADVPSTSFIVTDGRNIFYYSQSTQDIYSSPT